MAPPDRVDAASKASESKLHKCLLQYDRLTDRADNKSATAVEAGEKDVNLAGVKLAGSNAKGRITVFSISGCPHCKQAKSLLKKKGFVYTELNLDVFPDRRQEMEDRAHRTSCPQIFFNEELIGGNDNLQALEKAGQLDEKLEHVRNIEAPPSAPVPPPVDAVPTSADATQYGDVGKRDADTDLINALREAVEIKDRWYKLQKYERCFVGSEAVTAISKYLNTDKAKAVSEGQRLLTKHFLHHVMRQHDFRDDHLFFRFFEHEGFSTDDLNWGGETLGTEPLPANELGEGLRKLILAIYDDHLSEDGRHVDYKGVAGSFLFKRYVEKTRELQRVDVGALDRANKLAFFINIYNAMVIHVTTVLGHGPTTVAIRKVFFSKYKYVVAGKHYSLSDIENGILRGNKRAPYALHVPFGKSDERAKVSLPKVEPLIHFALVCGAKSCPPITTYKAPTVDDSLEAAARAFLQGGGCEIGADGVVSLSKILYWYKSDFGADDKAMLTFVARKLSEEDRAKLEGLVEAGTFKIVYKDYNWGSNE